MTWRSVWFSDADQPQPRLLFCLVCHAYGGFQVRHW